MFLHEGVYRRVQQFSAQSRLKEIQKLAKKNENLEKTIDKQMAKLNKSWDKENSLKKEIEKLEKEYTGLRIENLVRQHTEEKKTLWRKLTGKQRRTDVSTTSEFELKGRAKDGDDYKRDHHLDVIAVRKTTAETLPQPDFALKVPTFRKNTLHEQEHKLELPTSALVDTHEQELVKKGSVIQSGRSDEYLKLCLKIVNDLNISQKEVVEISETTESTGEEVNKLGTCNQEKTIHDQEHKLELPTSALVYRHEQVKKGSVIQSGRSDECLTQWVKKGTDVDISPKEHVEMCISETTESTGEEVNKLEHKWDVSIERNDKARMETLINEGHSPSTYETFLRAIDILHGQQKLIRRLCRLVSEDILTLFDRTKIIKVYAATTANNPKITFIVVSRYPVSVPMSNGYPVYVKDISNAVLEDKAINESILCMSTANKAKLNDVKLEIRQKLPTLKSVMKGISRKYMRCPNVSQITSSTVKARNFSYNEKQVYTVDCEPTLCMVIYVYCKGWIPVGWASFPAIDEGYPIDVREFYELKSQMITDLQRRTFQCYVYEIRTITTQGLLERQSDSSVFGLTCAHSLVVAETEQYPSCLALDEDKQYVALDRQDCKQKIPDQMVKVERLAYGTLIIPDEDIEAFVDVALIHIQQQSKLHIESLSDLIQEAFKQEAAPEFHYSEEDDAVYEEDIVLKFGASTKLTFGTVTSSMPANLPNAPGLILVEGVTKPFSENGDSGALVFKVNPRLLKDEILSTLNLGMGLQHDSNKLILIGMVYGSPPDNETITYCTQITPCLKALGEAYTFLSK